MVLKIFVNEKVRLKCVVTIGEQGIQCTLPYERGLPVNKLAFFSSIHIFYIHVMYVIILFITFIYVQIVFKPKVFKKEINNTLDI